MEESVTNNEISCQFVKIYILINGQEFRGSSGSKKGETLLQYQDQDVGAIKVESLT